MSTSSVFHVELRQFPHSAHAYNLSEPELRRTVLDPWRAGRPFVLGELEWIPGKAQLTVLEGPSLHTSELSMGRGWSAARRQGQEVTEALLTQSSQSAPDDDAFDSFRRELRALGAADLISVQAIWRMADSWYPGRRLSERLGAAEAAIYDLLSSGQAELCRGTRASAPANPVPLAESTALLMARDTWTEEQAAGVFLRTTEEGATRTG